MVQTLVQCCGIAGRAEGEKDSISSITESADAVLRSLHGAGGRTFLIL